MPQAPQYLVLTVSFFVIETVWQLIYTVSGRFMGMVATNRFANRVAPFDWVSFGIACTYWDR